MNRRQFLAIGGAASAGLLLPRSGLIAVPEAMVLHLAGTCSFCGQAMPEAPALAGLIGQRARICSACVALCLDILAAPPDPQPPPRTHTRSGRDEQELREALAAGGLEAHEIEAFLSHRGARPGRPPWQVSLACSFCGASQHEVDKLIAGPDVYVCGDCVGGAGTLLSWSGLRT